MPEVTAVVFYYRCWYELRCLVSLEYTEVGRSRSIAGQRHVALGGVVIPLPVGVQPRQRKVHHGLHHGALLALCHTVETGQIHVAAVGRYSSVQL